MYIHNVVGLQEAENCSQAFLGPKVQTHSGRFLLEAVVLVVNTNTFQANLAEGSCEGAGA